MNQKNFLLFILLVQLTNFSVSAQTGTWNPASADTSFPRTLFKAADIPAVKSSLSDSQTLILFSGIYSSASQTVPSDSTDASRLLKSHIAKNAAFIVLLGKK
jgi:hypothetical protein